MDFQKLLLEAGKDLTMEEVKSLAFLCADLLGRNLSSVESARDLFSRLVGQDHLSPERPNLLTELLLIINRNRLIRDLELTDQVPRHIISPYRKLLYNLSENLTKDGLKDMKFLLNNHLPRTKLEENVTTLEVFLELEHRDLIKDTNLDLLVTIFKHVCPILVVEINQFQALITRPSLVAQETARPRSQSHSYEPVQVPQTPGRKYLYEISAGGLQPLAQVSSPLHPTQSNMNSLHTSVDLPNPCHGGSECEALSNKLHGLNVETSNSASCKGHDMVIVCQESKTSSGKPTNTDPVVGSYPMTSAKRGICLIVNNYNFRKSRKRGGTMIDEECLQKVFEWLGFDVETHRDCTSDKMLSVMEELSSRDHSKMDSVVCCILSHGQQGCVLGVDEQTVSIRKLMQLFSGSDCSSLVGKPKLFFIQACQGKKEQRAVYLQADGPAQSLVYSDTIEAKDSIPSDADFLLGLSTVPFYICYREPKTGSWYIQSLCQNLIQMVPSNEDLVTILTKVNADISQRTDPTGEKKQMPQPAFTLTKKVIFPIPEAAPPKL